MAFKQDFTTSHTSNWWRWAEHLIGTPANMVEVGTWEGRTAIWWLENILTHEDARLMTIDCQPQPTAVENLKPYCKASIVQKLSRNVLPHLTDKSVDIAYIDGSHDGVDVLRDALELLPKLKPNGLMIFDDFHLPLDRWSKVRCGRGIEAFLSLAEGPYVRVVAKTEQQVACEAVNTL